MDTMNKFCISGLVTLDKYAVDIWRVYFLGQLTVSKFASRAGAMGPPVLTQVRQQEARVCPGVQREGG
jgi:hypothetical protein